jgi:hypothetical protein
MAALKGSAAPVRWGYSSAGRPAMATAACRRASSVVAWGLSPAYPTTYHAKSDGRQSCAASEGPTGDGFLRYREHTIKFTFSESRAGTTARVELDGKRGGAFEGTANASGDEDPVEIAEKCTSTGLRQAGATITGSTAPEISG